MEELNVTNAVSATPTAAVTPVVSSVATPTTTPATPAPGVVPLTTEEYRKMLDDRNKLERYEADQARRDAEIQAKELEAIRKTGDAQKLLDHIKTTSEQAAVQMKAQHDAAVELTRKEAKAAKDAADREIESRNLLLRQTEIRAQNFAKSGELSRAISSRTDLVPGAAEDLHELLHGKLNVEAVGDTFAVKTASGQTAAELVAHALSTRPHMLRANNPQGGTGGVQPHMQSAPNVPGTPETPPANMGEAVIRHMQNMHKAQGEPRTNMSLSMGLKAVPKVG